MPKKSTVAIATSQTQSQTFTAEQAIQRHTDTAPMFAVYVMLDGGEVDGITQGIRHYVGTAQTRKEANAKGLQALTKYENAITCEIVEISDKPYRLYIEGSDREAWMYGRDLEPLPVFTMGKAVAL